MSIFNRRKNTPQELPTWSTPVAVFGTVVLLVWIGGSLIFGGSPSGPTTPTNTGTTPVVVGTTPSTNPTQGGTTVPGQTTTAPTAPNNGLSAAQVAEAAALAFFTNQWNTVPVASASDIPPAPGTTWPAAVANSTQLLDQPEAGVEQYQVTIDPDGEGTEPPRAIVISVRLQDGAWVYYSN